MSYNVVISADFGAANTGLTVHGKLFGTNGVQVGSTITTGFVEAVSGLYVYVLSCPDSQEGVFVAYDSANTSLRRVAVVAPRETENADVKSSTLATTTALTSLSDKVGTPAGVSVAADIAAVQADTDNIQTRIPASLVGGRIDASVGAMASNVVTAAAIATNAIDADALAADAVAEIQSGLATSSSIAALNNLSAAQVNAEVDTALADVGLTTTVTGRIDATISSRLASASYTAPDNATISGINTKLGTPAGASVSADVAAIKAETASIQSDTNDLQTQIGTAGAGLTAVASAANLATLTAYVDTEVAAIKAKTDNLPADPADASDIAASLTAITGYIDTEVATILAAVDTEIAAIKAKTDNLPATPASTSDIPGTAAIATAVFAVAVETGHDLTTVLRAIYAAIRGRSVANNGDNPTTITYYAPDNSTSRIVHTLTDTERTVA